MSLYAEVLTAALISKPSFVTDMSLCTAILSLSGSSFKLDWREGARLNRVVDFLVEEGCAREDAVDVVAKFEKGGASQAH